MDHNKIKHNVIISKGIYLVYEGKIFDEEALNNVFSIPSYVRFEKLINFTSKAYTS